MTSNEKKLLFVILNNLYSKGVEKELILKIIDSGELECGQSSKWYVFYYIVSR